MYDENDHMEMKGVFIFSVLKFDENGDVNLLQPTTLQHVFSRNRITLLYGINHNINKMKKTNVNCRFTQLNFDEANCEVQR